MHPENPHQGRYNFSELKKVCSDLSAHVIKNKLGEDSINFDNPESVRILNKAILKSVYGVSFWELPSQFLCPPIPGRADYIFNISDFFPKNKKLHGIDIGVGANCIYPLIGHYQFDWTFVATDISSEALKSSQNIIEKNNLEKFIELRLQKSSRNIFEGIISANETYDFSLCNPPFHASAEEALVGTERKRRNLGLVSKTKLNFGGKSNELWCEGGEKAFVANMILESQKFASNVTWFTSLISKESHLHYLQKKIENVKAKSTKIVQMSQGQKKSRILAWSFQK
ncbi:MAG: 23S rRNA (adenine(1618)-N(6))-methyltransferase RlmF [Bacteriovoracaceae bacterium]